MTTRPGQASSPLRQLATLTALLEHITASTVLDGAIVWWDQHPIPDRVGAHKWVTNDLVLVECLLAAPDCGWHPRTASSPVTLSLPSRSPPPTHPAR
jgi:hypothetical protein